MNFVPLRGKIFMESKFDVLVVGGGASGFFSAIRLAELRPDLQIGILEKTEKVLSKVKISGGGRCNVTHDCQQPAALVKHYPRGEKKLKKLYQNFDVADTIAWFKQNGVQLKAESDGRMFPITDSSQTIIDCFLQKTRKLGIQVLLKHQVLDITKNASGDFDITLSHTHLSCKYVIVSTGGNPSLRFYEWIERLGHTIIPPRPSLFTFNTPKSPLLPLAGISVPNAHVRIVGTKLEYSGPLLITHWGLSGPAVLKLSAWGAEWLAAQNYDFQVHVRWQEAFKEDQLREDLRAFGEKHPKKQVAGNPLFDLPSRLWKTLCQMAQISDELRWCDTSKKDINRLLENLLRMPLEVKGKTTFKEEFVTCGGVDLSEVDDEDLESKIVEGLYFAGEVLNIDGITGGFNFQAAWTTANQVAHGIAADLGA